VERTGKNLNRLNVLGRDSSALALKGLLAFLQGVFKEGFFGYKWVEDRNNTDIIIAEGNVDGSIDPEDVEKLPAIFVHEGPAQWQSMNAAAIALWERTRGHKQLKSPETFTLVAQVVAEDVDEMKDITATVFTMIPTFPSLIGKRTGISFPGSPVRAYGLTQAKSGSAYPTGIINLPCSVMVGLDVSREKGSLFDTLLKNVTMTITAALPEPETRRTNRFILGNTPKDMLDVVVHQRRYRGNVLVDDPLADEEAEEGCLEQQTELTEE